MMWGKKRKAQIAELQSEIDALTRDLKWAVEEREALRAEVRKLLAAARKEKTAKSTEQAAKAKTIAGQVLTAELVQDMARRIVKLEKRCKR